jgi:ubiquinone/menaquinone biosynthesis C-methylase UbiE
LTERQESKEFRDVQRQFGRRAAHYLGAKQVFGEGESLDAMAELASLGRYRWAVDLATGAGYTGLKLKPFVERFVLTDITFGMLSQARSVAGERGVEGVDYVQGVSETLPFADGSLDMVSCRFGAHHFIRLEEALAEMSRILKPGGVFLLADTVPSENDSVASWMNSIEKRRDSTHVANFKSSQWHTLIEVHGLEVTHSLLRRVDLEFFDWVERGGTSELEVAALREDFLNAPQVVKETFGIREEGNGIAFFWPCIVLRAVKP